MPHIDINELHKERNKRSSVRSDIYNNILAKCHNKIKSIAKLSDVCCCFFEVPAYVYGLPSYNLMECIYYIIKELMEDGFKVEYAEPNILLVTWYSKPKRKTLDQLTKETRLPTTDNTRKTTQYHSRTGSLYHDGLSEMEVKSNQIFKDDNNQPLRPKIIPANIGKTVSRNINRNRNDDISFTRENRTFADFNPTGNSRNSGPSDPFSNFGNGDDFKTLSFNSDPTSRKRKPKQGGGFYGYDNSKNNSKTNQSINNTSGGIKREGFRSLYNDSAQDSTYSQLKQNKSNDMFKPVSLDSLNDDINFVRNRSKTPEPDSGNNIGFSAF